MRRASPHIHPAARSCRRADVRCAAARAGMVNGRVVLGLRNAPTARTAAELVASLMYRVHCDFSHWHSGCTSSATLCARRDTESRDSRIRNPGCGPWDSIAICPNLAPTNFRSELAQDELALLDCLLAPPTAAPQTRRYCVLLARPVWPSLINCCAHVSTGPA